MGVGRARGGDRRRRTRHGSRGRGRENSNREFNKKEASEVSGRLNLINRARLGRPTLQSSHPRTQPTSLKKTRPRFFFFFFVFIIVVLVVVVIVVVEVKVRRNQLLGIPLPLWRVLTVVV